MSKLRRVLSVLVIISLCLLIAQNAPAAGGQSRGGGMGMGGGRGNAAGRGMMGGFSMQADPRVENKTYILEDTNEPMPYSLFVSSKVDKEKEAPLIIFLHGLGVDNTFMMRGEVLDLAEKGGYIVAAPLGYTSGGWFGIASMAQAMGGMGRGGAPGAGGRGGAPGGGAGRGMGPGGAPGAGRGGRGGAPGGVPNTGVPGAAMANPGGGLGGAPGGGMGMGGRGGAPGGGGMGMFSFGSSTGGTAVTDPGKIAELSEKDVMNVLEIVRKEYKVDKKRTYLMGHSMGGAGTLYLGVKYADNWAAIGAMAPAAFTLQPDSLEKAKDMPVIIIQGDADTLVQPNFTRPWADKMKELGMTYEYKELPGVDHGSVITAGIPLIFEFFEKHSKSGQTAPVSTAAATSSAAKPGSFDGRWTGSTEIQGYGMIPFGYDFKSDGNKLTGTSDGQTGPLPIVNGKIDGDKITFNVTINLNGQDIVVNYTGVLTDDGKLKLTWPGQNGTVELICSRQ